MSAEETTIAATTPTSPSSGVPLSALENINEEVGDQQHCLVCYSDLHHPGILPCGHNDICGVCHLRLRHLHGNKKCPICKEEHEKIIADIPSKPFEEYPIWGDDLGGNYIFRKNVGMFFPADYYAKTIEPLFGYHCTYPKCVYDGTLPDANIYDKAQEEIEAQQNGADDGENDNNHQQQQKKKKGKSKPMTPLRALQDHLRVKHRSTLCQLCIDHKRDFVAALPRFAPHQLKKHLTKGDGPGSGFEGHPICEFCRPKRFYDLTHLHIHLQKDHYKCHVCEKQGQQNQYFRNYESLEKHFDRGHFLCKDPQCLQARFVVFENEIDFHAHERQVHGGTTAGSSKIQLEFRTRRTGYDGAGLAAQQQEAPSEEDFNFGLQGEAFVPAALPRSNEATVHPLHLQRTAEFREHSNQVRQQQEQETQGASFPTLQAATAGAGGEDAAQAGSQFSLGWTSGTAVTRVAGKKKNAGAVTENDFPSLPSGPKKSSASSKLRAGAPSNNRQFAAIRAVAAQPGGGGWTGSSVAAAAPPSSYQYNADAFPPAHSIRAPVNRAENLGAGNFPALGGGSTKAPRHVPVTNLSSKFKASQPAPSWNSAVDFPAPGTSAGRKPPAASYAAPAPTRQKPPSFNSQMDFPAPPSAASNKNSVKEKLMGGQKKQPTRAAMNNMLQVPQTPIHASASPKDTLKDMQASLGPTKYKKLKKFTREFAEGDLESEAYIDHAAALFDRGYGDPDFWKTMPALVSSCPHKASADEALRYMESLRTKAAFTVQPINMKAHPNTSNSWGAATPLDLTTQSFPTPSLAAGRPQSGPGSGRGAVAPGQGAVPKTRYVVPSGKKKGAWGNGAGAGPKSVKQGTATPVNPNLSVASAAANQGPQGGTATKFMAKETKQQKAALNNSQNKGIKKKKEKDELRQLAFGGR